MRKPIEFTPIVQLDSVRGPRFARVAPAAAKAKLRAETLKVLIALGTYANADGQCWPSNSRIAADSGIGRRHLSRAIRQAVDAGLLLVERRAHVRNIYTLVGVATRGDAVSPPVVSEVSPPVVSGVATGGTRAKRTSHRTSQEGTESVVTPPRVSGDFDRAEGVRLAEDWQPDIAQFIFAEKLGLDPVETADRFRDYWIAIPGAKGMKSDWGATWRNWCRREAQIYNQPRPSGSNRPTGDVVTAVREFIAEGVGARPQQGTYRQPVDLIAATRAAYDAGPLRSPVPREDGMASEHALGEAGDRLCRRIGQAQFAAWFLQVRAEIIEGNGVLRLIAPSKFIAAQIRQRYDAAIYATWRTERLEIVVE